MRTVAPRRVLMGGVTALLVVAMLMLLNVTVGHVIGWATIALMACFMGSIGFVDANATALALSEVPRAAGTGSAVLGFLQYGMVAVTPPLVGLAGQSSAVPMGLVMFGAAALAALSMFVLTRGHVPFGDEADAAGDAPVTVSAGGTTSR